MRDKIGARWTTVLAGVALTLLVATADCGGKSALEPAGSEGAGGSIALDQLPAQYAAAACDSLGPCCAAEGIAYDATVCKEQAERGLVTLFSGFDMTHIQYDAIAAKQCLDAYAAALRTCADGDLDWEVPLLALPLEAYALAPPAVKAACRGVFVGTVPVQGSCRESLECARSADGTAGCAVGSFGSDTCYVSKPPPPRGKAGEACAGNCSRTMGPHGICSQADDGGDPNNPVTALCYRNDGLYCSSESGTPACAPLVALGGHCGAGGCVPGAFCAGDVCVAQTDAGPCVQLADWCSSSAYCDISTNRCTPRIPDDMTCSSTIDTSESESCASGYCQLIPGPRASRVCGRRKFVSEGTCAGELN